MLSFPEQSGTGQRHNQDIAGSCSYLCLILGLGGTGDGESLQAPHTGSPLQPRQRKIPAAFILWLG